ncbi:MAG: hypothetical protein ACW98A_05400 [Candidatus Hodarchaeales archaeon]
MIARPQVPPVLVLTGPSSIQEGDGSATIWWRVYDEVALPVCCSWCP